MKPLKIILLNLLTLPCQLFAVVGMVCLLIGLWGCNYSYRSLLTVMLCVFGKPERRLAIEKAAGLVTDQADDDDDDKGEPKLAT